MIFMLLSIAASGDLYDPAAGSFLDEAGFYDQAFASGDSCYRVQDYEGAVGYYIEGLRAQPWDEIYIYNLACCYGLLERADLATTYLRRAWRAGFRDMELLGRDTDFDAVRNDAAFSSLVDSLVQLRSLETDLVGVTHIVSTTGPFRCVVKTPEDYDGSEPLPLLLGLHGYGGTPERFIRLWNIAGEFRCILAAPQAPFAFDTGDGPGYSWFEEGYSEAQATDYVLSVLDYLEGEYNVGEVYLFGYSQGAGLTYLVGFREPARFAGIAPFSGWLPDGVTDAEIEAARSLPVRIVHGEQDDAVDFDAALQAVSVLASHGCDVELSTFQGDHRFDGDLFRAILVDFLGTD